MTSITRDLRKDLEKAVKQARRVAEAGARQAVQQLRVGDGEAPKDLTANQRALRTRLRAHGRQLGDRRDDKTGTQETAHLVQECAYEHWHRMLFARFLAETDLLIEPESGLAITLDDVQELARERTIDWLELASEYAERMLPQIFRKGDPALEIALPREARSALEYLLKGLSHAIFQSDDSLGWVYQFWQAEQKEEIDQAAQSGKKIGAEELPAVTQLFTEDYMVRFILDNTLGAWWAGKVLTNNPDLSRQSRNEEELRSACQIGNLEWPYLRFCRVETDGEGYGEWAPAAGSFLGWPKSAKDITLLDPCMGSGHFLVFALPILARLRMAEENIDLDCAISAVLRDNLFGLEIDPRCTQIAAFNVAFTAWRLVGFHALPQLNLACSGLAPGVGKQEWSKLSETALRAADPAAKSDLFGVEQNLLTAGIEARTKNGLNSLYDLFAMGPSLGSLIDPRHASGDIFNADYTQMSPLLGPMVKAAQGDETIEMAVAAQGMTRAAEFLGREFVLVATNVPYLGRRKQAETMRSYCEDHFPKSKTELATCFVERCLSFCTEGGSVALVTPQNWLFLGTFSEMRLDLLERCKWNFVAKLGPAAFQDMNWWAATTLLVGLTRSKPTGAELFLSVDASGTKDLSKKSEILKGDAIECSVSSQSAQIYNPDHAIVFGERSDLPLLDKYADAYQGSGLADIVVYRKLFWEIPDLGKDWVLHQSSPDGESEFSGLHFAVLWEGGKGTLTSLPEARIQGKKAWDKMGIACAWLGRLPTSLYLGTLFDNSAVAIVPKDPNNLAALWCYLSSDEFVKEVRKINQKSQVANATLVKVPFDIERWQNTAAKQFPSGLPAPDSPDPTQWLFKGNPKGSTNPLHVAVARLVGYRWPRQNNVELKYVDSIESDGLEKHVDTDGIVCLAAVKGEAPAAQRLNAFLAESYGNEWSANKLASLLKTMGHAGNNLDDWLRDEFFSQHCETFHHRPFVWHVWDGRRDGFHALINYHRLAGGLGEGRRILEKLIYSYLGDWIDRQRADQKVGVEGADGRLAAAEHLRAELTKILDGHPPYDIFVRWKPLIKQPVGWEPDINDGVRVNIRPFMTARSLGARGANACILRVMPKIKLDKDRGKEPNREKADYPWFWGWDETSLDFAGGKEFDGNRWVDLHYSHAVKQAARDRHLTKAGGKT